jgi:hypothetical protein
VPQSLRVPGVRTWFSMIAAKKTALAKNKELADRNTKQKI